ncbi:hypothetical protein Trydic_g19463 [Trypoxylus dichotomus]
MNFFHFINSNLSLILLIGLLVLANEVASRDNYATHRDSKYHSPGYVQAYVKTYKDASFKWGVRFGKNG